MPTSVKWYTVQLSNHNCLLILYEIKETLDADDVPLKSSDGKTMLRDIVQFVSFEELRHRIGMDFSLVNIPHSLHSFLSFSLFRLGTRSAC